MLFRLLAALTTLSMLSALAVAQLTPIDLSALANFNRRTLCCGAGEFPVGNVAFLGIPFNMGPTSGNNSIYLSGPNPVTIEIPINSGPINRVHTIINTEWGQPGPNSYLRIEFIGNDSSLYAVNLIGGVHMRDYGPDFTQTFNQNPPTCTRNVFIATGSRAKVDMQTFALPASIRTAGLNRIRLIDTGATGFQRGIFMAATLDSRICEANINDDCVVDFFDYLDFVALFADNDPESDFNGDGVIDLFDYLDYVAAFASGC